jgi:3-dehydroquinate dehydratase-2
MNKIVIINGPNLNFLGTRESEIYGHKTDLEIINTLKEKYTSQLKIEYYQTNSEGRLIDYIQQAYLDIECIAIIINPAGYSHNSIAISDCYKYKNKPIIEVHISDYTKRQSYRNHSLTGENATHLIYGKGNSCYEMGIEWIKNAKN